MIGFSLLLFRRTGSMCGDFMESGDHLFADADCKFSDVFAGEADSGNGGKN